MTADLIVWENGRTLDCAACTHNTLLAEQHTYAALHCQHGRTETVLYMVTVHCWQNSICRQRCTANMIALLQCSHYCIVLIGIGAAV